MAPARSEVRSSDEAQTSEVQYGSPFTPAEIDVGRRLRELRTDRGLSLRELARRSSLNFNTLSLIENGKTSPNVSTLQSLASTLNVPITAFFETEPHQKSIVYQKVGQRYQAAFACGKLEDLGAGMQMAWGQPLRIILDPGADSGPSPIVHTGHEFVYCLDGRLKYEIEDQSFILESGDSLLFEAHLPHRWENVGDIPTVSLLVLCPADENDQPTERHFSAE